jgi:phosphate transport system permease protein
MSDINKKHFKHMLVVSDGLKSRYLKEKIFRASGISALIVALLFLAIIVFSISTTGYKAFAQTYIKTEIILEGAVDSSNIEDINYLGLIRDSLRRDFPELSTRAELADLYRMVSIGAQYELEQYLLDNLDNLDTAFAFDVLATSDVDMVAKSYFDDTQEQRGRLTERQYQYYLSLLNGNRIDKKFNTNLFTRGDSSNPEMAGILGAAMGSFFVLAITFFLSFPIGVGTAIYLEEFASKNRFNDFIEVNINNLAAVPSVIFGLLGLSVFINFFNFPRSAPLVGGLVLTLMTLPVVIIASRAAITSVPPSIREAALGLGASKLRVISDHIIPLALPGMLTGAIIGMARALGESAPLLMIGMVAFITEVPNSLLSPATTLPIQVYLWADSPERGFVERTSAAIIVLLVFLVIMNLLAVYLRKRFEKKW